MKKRINHTTKKKPKPQQVKTTTSKTALERRERTRGKNSFILNGFAGLELPVLKIPSKCKNNA